MATIAEQISSACDELAELREELQAGPSPERAQAIREQITRVKDRQAQLQQRFDALWEQAHAAAPQQMRLDQRTGIIYVTTAAMGGGRSIAIAPEHPRYAEVKAQVDAQRAQDAAVAEVAFAAWGWRGNVRISYYGDLAVVSRGGDRLTIDTATMSVRR